jgi:hypothetical protein
MGAKRHPLSVDAVMMGFAIASSPRVLNRLALQTWHKAASGCKGLFGLVANRSAAPGHGGTARLRLRQGTHQDAGACSSRQPPIKKLKGCDGMHEIRTLLSERMREVRAELGAHSSA